MSARVLSGAAALLLGTGVAMAFARGPAGAAGLPGGAGADTSGALVLRGHTRGVTSVRFSPDGRWLASSGLDGSVRVWSAPDGRLLRTLPHGAEVYSLAISPGGDCIASTGGDARVRVWDAASGREVGSVTLPTWSLAVAFTPAGELLAGSADGRVRVLDPASGRVLRDWAVGGEVFGLAVSPDGRLAATSPLVKVWELGTGAEAGRPRAFGQGGLAFSRSGRHLATGEYTGGARVFAAEGWQPLGRVRTTLQRHAIGPHGPMTFDAEMPVVGVAFSPDGSLLATGGGDRRVQLWPLEGGVPGSAPARVLEGHAMTVTGVAFSGDGAWLASSSLDRTVRLWPLR